MIARVVAWVRAEADELEYARACEWRNVADAIEREGNEEPGWTCRDCSCLNRDDEACCFRCGAGRPEEA